MIECIRWAQLAMARHLLRLKSVIGIVVVRLRSPVFDESIVKALVKGA